MAAASVKPRFDVIARLPPILLTPTWSNPCGSVFLSIETLPDTDPTCRVVLLFWKKNRRRGAAPRNRMAPRALP